MEIYFVRHGQTSGNIARRHQPKKASLTPEGRAQAELIVDRIKEIQPTHLLTSNLVRAIETARVIGDACDLIPATSENFVELVRPNHIYGRYHRSVLSLMYYAFWYLGRDTSSKNGGESYASLRRRIREAQAELSSYPEDSKVVIISHSVFISMFVAHLCREKPLRPFKAFVTFMKLLKMPNTHITSIKFSSKESVNGCTWSVDS